MRWSKAGPSVVFLAAVIFLATAVGSCGTVRDTSTPGKALLGHWKNVIPGSSTEVYYDGSRVVFSGKRNAFALPYSILLEDRENRSLTVHTEGQLARAPQTSRVVFSGDMSRMDVFAASVPGQLRFTYVDERRRPDGFRIEGAAEITRK